MLQQTKKTVNGFLYWCYQLSEYRLLIGPACQDLQLSYGRHHIGHVHLRHARIAYIVYWP